jgi:hypothetical protein
VTLRAATPGKLSLQCDLSTLLEHHVVFGADATSQTVETTEEGVHPVVLPGPSGTPWGRNDEMREVSLTLRGSYGDDRVVPVDGPAVLSTEALVLTKGRSVLVGIPATLASSFGILAGLRLRMRTEAAAELGGRLLETTASVGPGPAVRSGDVAPIQVAAKFDGWVTLPLAEPVPMPQPPQGTSPDTVAWVELIPTYGEIECGLTTRSTTSTTTPGARILRRLPGGGTRELSPLLGSEPLNAAIRVIGQAGKLDTLPAVKVRVDSDAGVLASAPITPTNRETRVTLGLSGLAATDNAVALDLHVASTGSVSISSVVVAYKQNSETAELRSQVRRGEGQQGEARAR